MLGYHLPTMTNQQSDLEPSSGWQFVTINLALGLLYLALAKLGLLLALPPGYATAIWPPAGLAFAACLIWGGKRLWPGILLGSLITNATIGDGFHLNGLAVAIACGSTLQALIGEYVLRRVDQRMELDRADAIGRFIGVSLLTCLIATTVGNISLFSVGFVSIENISRSFITWWLGDALGVLIFLPLTLVAADPRPLWKNRRIQVGVPLLAAFLLTGLVYWVVLEDEEHRLKMEFSQQAEPLIAELGLFSETYGRAISGLASLVNIVDTPTPAQFERYARTLVHDYPLLSSVAWLQLVRQDGLSSFQRSLSARLGRAAIVAPVTGHGFAADGWSAPVTLIEPLTGNAAALGRDLLSEPVRARAFRKAWQSGQMAATEKILLIQEPGGPGAFLLIVPVKAVDGHVRGFVSGVVNLRNLLKPLYESKNIAWSLRDLSAGTIINETLKDAPEFQPSSTLDRRGVYLQRSVKLADRELKIILHKPHSGFASQTISLSTAVLFMSLLISAGLGMFALVVSASAGRIAKEVEDRTRELRDEIALRKWGEQLVQESAVHTQTILDNVVDGIITIDVVGTVSTFNIAAENIFGYAADEVIGRNVKMLMPEPFHSAHDGYLRNYQESGVARIIGSGREVVGRRKDGSTFPLDLGVSKSVRLGQPLFIGVVRDITERKRIEQMKTEFVSTVSHELRTPLTSISGSLGLVTGGALGDVPAMMKPMIDIAHKNSLRLTVLINDLLDMEKLVAGKMTFDFQVQPLMSLIEQCLQSTQAYAEQYKVSFIIDERADDILVRVDGIRLQQVLSNFLSNAAKFSPAGDKVSIKARRHGNVVRVDVIDHGPGIPDEFRSRIFQKFSQADSSDTRQKGGSGLGLAISKELIERMDGRVDFHSTVGEGSCFHFDLPVVTEASQKLDAS